MDVNYRSRVNLADPGIGINLTPLGQVRPIMQGFHLWNVKKTYLELSAEAAATQQAKVQ